MNDAAQLTHTARTALSISDVDTLLEVIEQAITETGTVTPAVATTITEALVAGPLSGLAELVDVSCDGRCLDGSAVGVPSGWSAVPDHRCSLHGLRHVEAERDAALARAEAAEQQIAAAVAAPSSREHVETNDGPLRPARHAPYAQGVQ